MQIKQSVIALGSFDGVHIGHKALVSQCVKIAKDKKVEAIVYSFARSPKNVFKNTQMQLLLTDEKKEIIESLGANPVIAAFTIETSNQPPSEFIERLCRKYKPIALVVGRDYRFGKNAAGDVATLVEHGKELGFDVEIVDEVLWQGERVSSTRIRHALANGDIASANAMLGYKYFYRGVVKPKKQLGRKIGFPTVNLEIENKQIARKGVYASIVHDKSKLPTEGGIPAMSNLGRNPTVSDERCVYLESNVFDEIGDWYGKEIVVELSDFVRDERKFDSLDELVRALANDKKVITDYWDAGKNS